MAYTIPLDQPLSETQAKLIAQVGSMKNLANLPFLNKFKDFFKQGEGISLFDYLMKVLRSMGLDPQILIVAFINEVFRTEKLVELVLRGMAQLATVAKVKLDQTSDFIISSVNMTTDDKKKLSDINYNWLNSGLGGLIKTTLSTVLESVKIRIVQELMILIFGKPKKSEAAYGNNALTYDKERFDELMDEGVCGTSIFSVSSPANIRNEDLEYNRLKKIEQMQNGNLSFKVTCQGVDITLPDDPMYLFRDASPGVISSQPTTPQEAITNVFNIVGNQIQKGTSGDSSQSNASSGSKSFAQSFLETLITSITSLLKPIFVGIVNMTPGAAMGVSGQAYELLSDGLLKFIFNNSVQPNYGGLETADYHPLSSCDILKNKLDKNNLDNSQKKKTSLITILCNLILNMAIGFILAYVLEKVKKLIMKYIVKRAQEKMKRKVAKMKAKFDEKTGGRQRKKIEKSARQVKLMKKVIPVLQVAKNTTISNINIT